MGECCKCRDLDWPDPQEVVWSSSGREYCVFHAPQDEKWKPNRKEKYSVLEFNQHVFERINDYLATEIKDRTDYACFLSGTVFPGAIWFKRHYKKDYPLPPIDLSEAKFNGRADFSTVHFSGDIWFSGAIFVKDASFANAVFYDETWFGNVQFGGEASFLKAVFKGVARFEESIFANGAWFQYASFQDAVNFDRATFKQGSLFLASRLLAIMTLDGCKVPDATIRIQSFSKQSLKNLTFTPSELPALSFERCSWPDRLGLEVHGNNDGINLLACEELYRAMKQKAADSHDQPLVSHWHFREKLMQLKGLLLPTNCNALIEAVEDPELCNGTRVRAWWELFRALPWRLRVSLPFLYWTFSGFGERATRGAACLIVLVLLPVFILSLLKLIETGWSLTPDSQRIAEVLIEWLRCMPFAKLDTPTSSSPTILSALRAILSYGFQLVIALQFTLFALAVRNRFRR